MPTRRGSIRLFGFLGINVYLHWSWFFIVWYAIQTRRGLYGSVMWNVIEVLALFLIVLMHEFGHALACRQVGGQANQIVLWPFGGVAYVAPPQRPGAMLWSIAAGPLVNVALFPVLGALYLFSVSADWPHLLPNVHLVLFSTMWVNILMLMFNLLPIYPLDGGQILRSLLWFVFGRANSLMIASSLGFAGVALLGLIAYLTNQTWLGALTVFIGFNCWLGFQQARFLVRLAKVPRRDGFACPVCKAAPPLGAFWMCGNCRKPFDPFATQAICPHCHAQYGVTACMECGSLRPIHDWFIAGSPSSIPGQPPLP
jgi:Zn-dependent protease